MATVEVDGVELFVSTVGTGPPAVVLHGGLGIDHTAYRSLDPLASELRLIFLDHRGNGRSARPDPATLSMARWAEDARAVARAVAGRDPFVVVGHSYGGFIAEELAVTYPDDVRGLVLVCTTPGQLGTGEEPAPEGAPMPPEFAEMLASMPETDEALATAFARLAPAYVHSVAPDVLSDLLAATVFSAATMRRGFEVLGAWSSVDRLHLVTAPTLVIAGRHDPFTGWPQAHRIASRIPHADVVLFEASSHFPWLDEPEQFFACVTTWLREHVR